MHTILNNDVKIEEDGPFEISVGTQPDEYLRIHFMIRYNCRCVGWQQKSLEVFKGVERRAEQVYRISDGE